VAVHYKHAGPHVLPYRIWSLWVKPWRQYSVWVSISKIWGRWVPPS